ncbi:LysR family transcriptional regulator [Photobacterium sp. WH77]|uniref:LysR family transcriptional regulator n=1 Tax=unclassified Photobacterium TaxID=2628852 RepID=UPI001EDAC9D7|nr:MULTISPECIES: LysR family transcriptional regulator [unclassified Photobacterium]MCG2836247.1 LysR family transcriptional regulator [Photobacterium sp. WH77]MCG2843616.1 LysR family transcriptional regulator [Photobacterium sp. WH80]
MKVNPKHLSSIEILAKVKSFRVASQILCISQPALSKQIKNFEDAYEIEMFVRDSQGVVLSDTGKLVINEITALNRHIKKTDELISSISQNNLTPLSIGFGKSSNDFLPVFIRDFQKKHSNISISLSDICSQDQEDQLLSGSLDIGFMRKPASQSLGSIRVSSDEFVLAVSKSQYDSDHIDFYLQKYNLLMMSNHSKSQINLNTMSLLKNRTYKITNISADLQTIITLILSNTGVAILPKKSILGIYDAIQLIPFPKETSWDIHMVWNPNRLSRSVELFIEHVKDQISTPASV